MSGKIKLFGAALDALDDPERVALKRAWIDALQAGRVPPNMPRDPYDAIATPLIDEFPEIFESTGKVRLASWLTPCPSPTCLDDIDASKYRFMMDNDLMFEFAMQCGVYAERNIMPNVSGMFCVDHTLSLGNILACARAHGDKNMAVIFLDSHFDAIPTSLRTPAKAKGKVFPNLNDDVLHCGNFVSQIISVASVFKTNHIFVIGPSDYPPDEKPDDDESVREFREAYLSFMDKGVKLMPKSMVRAKSFAKDFEKLLDGIKTPYVYVSIDADVGSCACMNAVRFMDTVGLDEETIVGIARAISRRIKKGQFSLAGFDVAEVDVHLLGLEGLDGAPDRTAEVCTRFVKTLVGCE